MIGVILSGSPFSTLEEKAPKPDLSHIQGKLDLWYKMSETLDNVFALKDRSCILKENQFFCELVFFGSQDARAVFFAPNYRPVTGILALPTTDYQIVTSIAHKFPSNRY